VPPFAAVAVDGGGSSYWHPRADGDDPLGMIVSEVLPRLARQGYQVDKIGLAGWSTGGYGALLLAERLERGQVEPGQVEPGQVTPGQVTPGRVAAVAVSSPAIFASYADAHAANAGSFDGAADFAANDVQSPAGLAALKRIPVMIDCGSSDPFAAQDTLLRSHLGTPPGAISRGCHDQAFWRRHLPAELAFLGAHLTA
jgi:pimeloyl-ACP methyl ester carboxylesterase